MALAHCHRCNRETHWSTVRGSSAERCDDCADRFPCINDNCGHFDCVDARPHQKHLTDEDILNMTAKKTTKTAAAKKPKTAKKPAAAKKPKAAAKAIKAIRDAAAVDTKAAAVDAAPVKAPKAAKAPKEKRTKKPFDVAAKTDANPTGKTVVLKNGSIVPAFKYCANCDADHPADEFYANAGRPSGLSDWCKAAFKRWAAANKAAKAGA